MKKPKGTKYDAGKTDWFMLPWESIEEITKVMMFGREKYTEDNWKDVEPKRRYWSACIRHLVARRSGEKYDSETGLPHLAHAGCCIIFLLWFDLKGKLRWRR